MTILLSHDGQTMSRSDDTRTDYIHEDKYASLGLAVWAREPYAFHPNHERSLEWPWCEMPDSKSLTEVGRILDNMFGPMPDDSPDAGPAYHNPGCPGYGYRIQADAVCPCGKEVV